MSSAFRSFIVGQTEVSPIEAISLMDSNVPETEPMSHYFTGPLEQNLELTFSVEAMTKLLRGIRLGMVAGRPKDLNRVVEAQFQGYFTLPGGMKRHPTNLTTTK